MRDEFKESYKNNVIYLIFLKFYFKFMYILVILIFFLIIVISQKFIMVYKFKKRKFINNKW